MRPILETHRNLTVYFETAKSTVGSEKNYEARLKTVMLSQLLLSVSHSSAVATLLSSLL